MRRWMKLSMWVSLLFLAGCTGLNQETEVLVSFTGEYNEVINDASTVAGKPVELPEVTLDNAVFLGWFDASNPRYQDRKSVV